MVKFGLVGALGMIIDLGIYNLLAVVWDFSIYVSRTISFILAASNSYICNKIWTFQSTEKKIARQFSQFFLVSVVGLILNLAIMWLLKGAAAKIKSEILQKNTPVVVGIVIVFFWNFFANKYWTFWRDK